MAKHHEGQRSGVTSSNEVEKPLIASAPASNHRKRRHWKRQPKPEPVGEPDFDPLLGTWLDEDIVLRGSAGANLLESALLGLPIPHRSDHRRNFEARIECILANCFRAHFYRQSNRVAYRTGNNDYLGKPMWMSGSSMRKTVQLLVRIGLLERQEGHWAGRTKNKDGKPVGFKGRAATFWLTNSLLNLSASCHLTRQGIDKLSPYRTSLIRVRDIEKNEVPFALTADTRRWCIMVDRYNHSVQQTEISLSLDSKAEQAVIRSWNNSLHQHSKRPGIKALEPFERHLARIFNDGVFEHGGRLFGAWYQYVPRWARPSILIDDEPTVELDFSGMSIRMIYHAQGIDYHEDPYALSPLEKDAERRGQSKDYYRDSVKRVCQALLNNEDETVDAEKTSIPLGFGRRFTRANVRDMILEKHDRIAATFDRDKPMGKQCQRWDSDIALDIIHLLARKSIICLPVHDSFIVKREAGEQLRRQMIDSYRTRFNFDPVINQVGGRLA